MTKKKQAKAKRNMRGLKPSHSEAFKDEVVKAAYREITPPAHVPLKDRDIPFFNSVIGEMALAEWTDHTIEMAALLARAMSDLYLQQKMARKEGSVIQRGIHGPGVNPRLNVIKQLTTDILAIRRSMSLQARVKMGETRDIARRRAQAKEIESKIRGKNDDEDDDFDLLAKPK